jgi:signal transduction histidine kinase
VFVGRYEPGDELAIMAAWSRPGISVPPAVDVGARYRFRADSVSTIVRAGRRPARLVEYPPGHPAGDLGIRSSAGAPITVEGRLWGVVVVSSAGDEPPSPGIEERLAGFTKLVGTAIANAEAKAEVAASRARIVATADETRRRIGRDLHDGAQQRLVSLALRLRALQATVPPGGEELQQELGNIVTGLTTALEELREFARGIHPAVLAQGGLGAALRSLARRSVVPVTLDVQLDERLPEPVEVGAYYVVSEALVNTARHARAKTASVRVESRGDRLRITIADDGVGGADFARGSGLVGLKDRVEALGGRIALESRRGVGTTVGVELPLEDG